MHHPRRVGGGRRERQPVYQIMPCAVSGPARRWRTVSLRQAGRRQVTRRGTRARAAAAGRERRPPCGWRRTAAVVDPRGQQPLAVGSPPVAAEPEHGLGRDMLGQAVGNLVVLLGRDRPAVRVGRVGHDPGRGLACPFPPDALSLGHIARTEGPRRRRIDDKPLADSAAVGQVQPPRARDRVFTAPGAEKQHAPAILGDRHRVRNAKGEVLSAGHLPGEVVDRHASTLPSGPAAAPRVNRSPAPGKRFLLSTIGSCFPINDRLISYQR
jgi:hypothetical protein